MTVYDKGDNAVLTVTFRDSNGELTDPDVVKFRSVDPAGAVQNWTYPTDEIVRASLGVFKAQLPLPTVGIWSYHWDTEAGTVESSTLEVVAPATDRTAAEQVARSRLVRLLSPETEPVITDGDIDDLLRRARRTDMDGRVPSDAEWSPTWTEASIESAAADGWEIRAGRCFDDFDFGEDGQRFNASQRHTQCLAMAKLYRRGSGSVSTAGVSSVS